MELILVPLKVEDCEKKDFNYIGRLNSDSGCFITVFSSSKYQVGDYIYEGKYFDTAYDAFVDSGGCSEYELGEELATIKVTNDFAVWIASTKTHEFMLVK